MFYLLLSGCADLLPTPTENEYYHRMSMKPELREGYEEGWKAISVHNPFDTSITAYVDCDEIVGERWKKFNVKPNYTSVKIFPSKIKYKSCSMEKWMIGSVGDKQ
jgi:hypothetical protein